MGLALGNCSCVALLTYNPYRHRYLLQRYPTYLQSMQAYGASRHSQPHRHFCSAGLDMPSKDFLDLGIDWKPEVIPGYAEDPKVANRLVQRQAHCAVLLILGYALPNSARY